jgi:hypothetical protein
MQSAASIPIIFEPDEDGPRKAGWLWASMRLFTLSVVLGATLGTAMCVAQPERSLQTSLAMRAWIKSAVIQARTWAADLYVR